MTTRKVVMDICPFRVESAHDVGIAAQIGYKLVDPNDAGYDLFTDDQLEVIKKKFLPLNESRWNFSVTEFSVPGFYRVTAESKMKSTITAE